MKNAWKKAASGLALGAAAWILHRNRKYPLAKGLPPMNWFVVPGAIVSRYFASLGNRWLGRRQLPLPPDGIRRRSIQIPAEDSTSLRLTIYSPVRSASPTACLVYFHGGGFCFADAGYIHRNAAGYARDAVCMVVFVHYRTSDRHPFPVPFQDCRTALQYVWDNSASLGVDRRRIAVGGDSAGGALAAACTLWARDETDISLAFQMLLYPVTDARMETPSMVQFSDSPLWNARLNRRMWQLYLREGGGKNCAYASPMAASDFTSLPPAYIEAEEFDCLRDEALAYGRALTGAGTAVQQVTVKGSFHGFDLFRSSQTAQALLRLRGQILSNALHRTV